MGKYFCHIIIQLLTLINAFALEVTYELSPSRVMENENFKLVFQIKSSSVDEPFLSFVSQNLEMVKKNVFTNRESYSANGRLEIRKTYIFEYTFFAGSKGHKRLEQIKIDDGITEKKIPTISIEVVGKPPKPTKIFAEASVSKDRIYKGEGVNLDYYVYFSQEVDVNRNKIDIREFPKLNHFLNRHLKKPLKISSINYGEYQYNRINLYSSKIFPQKAGDLKIDPIEISVEYTGFMLGSGYNKIVDKYSSKTISINVIDLPEIDKKNSFNGLVGRHQISINLSRDHFFVNEPIELTLEVSGPGELENMAAPKLFTGTKLEEFEVKSDLQELDDINIKKIFRYTFLAREEMNIPPSDIEFAYFLPEEKKYEYFQLSLPGINVVGKTLDSDEEEKGAFDQKSDSKNSIPTQDSSSQSSAREGQFPQLVFYSENQFINRQNLLIFLLLIGNLIGLCLFLKKMYKKIRQKDDIDLIIIKIKSNGINYSNLHKLFTMLDRSNQSQLNDIINNSNISNDAKRYFLQIASECVRRTYGNNLDPEGIRYEEEYFEEVKKILKHGNTVEFKTNIGQ